MLRLLCQDSIAVDAPFLIVSGLRKGDFGRQSARIHIDIGETSVSKYLVHGHKPVVRQ
jgi:hypothetical protein